MSRVHNVLRGDKEQPSRKWYVKIRDGSSYGPVDMAVLCDWASQSRIAPGNMVSDDRTNWTPAQDLPELKMEWLARLPGGETYGPLNVLAVPHLIQNGILPTESILTNTISGKTLQIRDLIKPTTGSSPEQSPEPTPDDQPPAEQQHLDTGTHLLHDAEIQHSIDMLSYRPPLQEPASIKRSSNLQFEEIAAEVKPPMEQPAPKATINRDEVARLSRDAEHLKALLETAEKEIAAQIKEKERLTKLTAKMEDDLQSRLEQTEKELQQTRNELSTIKQRASDDYKGAETISKQAARKEQDLNRALEETRRKAEADAALLYKTRAQLEELKTQKAETQNRTAKEEAFQKSHALELEKQVQVLTSEVQAHKSQYQALEKEIQLKQDKAQAAASQLKEKADSAAMEITRLKKELESQKSLYVDVEKNVSEKEAVILKDVRVARVAQAKAETDAAALRKQLEVLKTQTGNKEAELQVRIEQLNNESRSLSTNAEKLRKELSSQNEEYRKIEKRAKNTEDELEKARFAARQAQEDRAALETRTKKQAEEIAKARVDYDNVRTSQVEVSSRSQEEKVQFLGRIEQLQVENMNIAGRAQELERQLAFHKQESEKFRAQTVTQGDQFSGQTEHLNNELRTLRDELAAAKQKHLEEKRSLESLERLARSNEQDARRQLDELSATSGTKTSQLGKIKKELAEALSTIAEMQEKAPAIETRFKKDLETRDARLADLEKSLNDAKKELKKQKEHYEAILEGERSRGQDLFSNAAMLETKIQSDDTRLEEANRKLADTLEQLAGEQHRFEQEMAARLEAEQARQLNAVPPSDNRAAELQEKVDKLSIDLEARDVEINKQKLQLANLTQGNVRLADELRGRIHELEEALKTRGLEIKTLLDRQKELEINAAKVPPDTGTRSNIPIGGVDFLDSRHSTTIKVAVSMLILAAMCSIGAFIAGQRTVRSKLEAQARADAQVIVQLQSRNNQAATTAKPATPVPRINADHTITIYTETSCMIIFDFGLFSTRTNMASDAMDTLEAVSSQLKNSLKDYRLIIEGHSDTMKITMSTTVEDNYALGMARANRVMEILANKFGLPPDAMVATSTGEKDPPFPNSDDSLRKKNRTVVLKLLPR